MADPHSFARRIVPDDHECLFSAIALLAEGVLKRDAAQRLRAVCADAVLADTDTFSEAVLGKEPAAYAAWIRNPFNWGGEIELQILANHYGVEITVVSMHNAFVLNYAAERATERVYLLYTGQHYDALVGITAAGEDAGEGDDIQRFARGDAGSQELALACAARELVAKEARDRQRVRKMIRCNGCGALLPDSDAFQAHCMEDNPAHGDDFDYMCEEVEVVEDKDAPLADGQVDLSDESKYETFYNSSSHPFSPLQLVLDAAGGAALPVPGVGAPTASSPAHMYRSPEHAVQAARFSAGSAARGLVEQAKTAEEAARIAEAHAADQLPQWEGAVDGDAGSATTLRESVLLQAIRAKFVLETQGGSGGALAAQLAATGDKMLVAIDSDRWAGMKVEHGISSGQNHVGKALMAVRAELGQMSSPD